MAAFSQPSYPNTARHIAKNQANPKPRYGLARRRQLRRQRRRRWLGGLTRGVALLWLLGGAVLPLIVYTASNTPAAQAETQTQIRSSKEKPPSTAISAGIIPATPRLQMPVQTATPTPLPTATSTPTALPPRLIQATAWQGTLDTAADFSHATQTQAAGQYAATQTALPPLLTANALERNATATATVR